MKKIFQDIFTGADGVTYDVARVLWFFTTLIGHLIYGFLVIFKGVQFDWVAYGSGNAALHGSFGASLWAKANTEPPHPSMITPNKPRIERDTE